LIEGPGSRARGSAGGPGSGMGAQVGKQQGSRRRTRAEDEGGTRFDRGSGVFRAVTASGGPLIGTSSQRRTGQ